MLKLLKYLKPYLWQVLLVVVLLVGQAWCELAMPDKMQNIVNTGIQNNGISSAVFEQISQKDLDTMLSLAGDSQKQTILAAYELVTPQTASEAQKEDIPALDSENVYILKEDADQSTLEDPLLLVEAKSLMAQELAEKNGVSLEQLAASGQLSGLDETVQSYIDSMGESTVLSMAAQIVKQAYQDLGMDMEAIQQNYILHAGLEMLGYCLATGVFAVTVGLMTARIAAGFARDVRKKVFEKVTAFSAENYSRFSTSTLLTRTTNDVQQVQFALMMTLRMVIYAPIIGIGAMFYVMQQQQSLTWIIALAVILIILLVAVLFTLVMPRFRLMQKLTDRLNSVIRELLDGMLVIRAFNNEQLEEKKFETANKDMTDITLFTSRAMATMMPVMMFIMNGIILLILWFGAGAVDEGLMQAGSIMAFIQYAMQVIMAFVMICGVSIMLPRANVAAGRIQEVLEESIPILEPEHPVVPESHDGVLKFSNVSFAYPDAGEEILSDISFETKPGEVTALIGSTGSGKSSLIQLVPRFYDVSKGSIELDGVNIKNMDTGELRRRIGYVPQKGSLFKGTIASNLEFANEDADAADMNEALDIAQALDFVNEKPEKLLTPIAQSGSNVSGGQRQRLAIARALVRKPEIYIFDDSFSALDFKTDAALRGKLMESAKQTGSTVLLVAQRIATILDADQIIVLDEGKIAGKGTHEELMKTCKVYQEIAQSQLSKEELENAAKR